MNINKKILELEKITGIPVQQDFYEGKSDKWITFVNVLEKGELYAEDEVKAELIVIQIHLFVPIECNYNAVKKKIKDYLEKEDFYDLEIQVFKEENKRHIIFECDYTEMRGE